MKVVRVLAMKLRGIRRRVMVSLISVCTLVSVQGLSAAPEYTVCAEACDFTTIQEALEASSTSSGAVLILSEPVHTEAGITIAHDVTIHGDSRLVRPIIQAHDSLTAATDRILLIQEGATVTLKNLTLRHGRAPRKTYPPSGGALCNYGTLTLDDCAVTHNQATDGGAILNRGTLTITNSLFSDNVADGLHPDRALQCGSGGAIKAETGELIMTRTTLRQNVASEKGGGLFIACHTTALVTESLIRDNRATRGGGGLYVRGQLRLLQSTVEHNVTSGVGGGLFIHGEVAFSRNTLRENTGYDCYLKTKHPYKNDGIIVENTGNTIADGSCPPGP